MRSFLALLLGAALLASCTLFTGHQNIATAPSSLDISAFQKSFMSSYYAERGGAPSGIAGGPRALTPFAAAISSSGSKATVPLNQLTSASWASLAPLSLANYPEPGQTTSFTAAPYATSGGFQIYDIKATTVFSAGDLRKNYVEEYYVENSADVLTWTINDPIVKLSVGIWVPDQSARVQMVLTFQDGSVRNETIISSSLSSGPKFTAAAFDVNGSLDLSQAFLPATTTDPNVMYSSIVQYYVTPAMSYNFWFWTGTESQTILGIRYYTEVATPPNGSGSYTAYTASFEKTLSNLTTSGGTFTTTLSSVYSGSQFATLAESVLRQQVVYGLGGASPYFIPTGTGAITTNMKTRIVNVAGNSVFYLTQMQSDLVSLTIPTANADAILTANPSLNVFTRTQSITPATGPLPFAIATSDLAGIGDLATLVTSISEGTYALPIATAPANSSLTGGTNAFTFVGQQAVGLSTTSALDLSSVGTVEAWVYMTGLTDTAGIVHNGVKVDFSDEGYSLQGWGAGGQIGIILDQKDPNPSGAYDYVLSTTNLTTNTWYYIAATWDRTVSPKKIKLYINGVLNASGTMNLTASGVRNSSNQVILGSQLPSIYSSSYGYFGINGKIVGANVTASALSAAQILTNYNTYKNNTSTWWP